MQNKIQALYDLTKKFNTISGSINEVTERAFLEQYSYIKEEFKELTENLGEGIGDKSGDKLTLEPYMLGATLDDCLDIVITVFGFMQKLETLGVDVGQAGIDTANNNLSKYTNILTVVYETIDKLRIEKGVEAYSTFNQDENVFVIRNKATGKIIKPIGFVPNDLSPYITQQVKENYVRANRQYS